MISIVTVGLLKVSTYYALLSTTIFAMRRGVDTMFPKEQPITSCSLDSFMKGGK